MFDHIPTPTKIVPMFAIWQHVWIMNDNKALECFVYQVHCNGERQTGKLAFRYDLVAVENWRKFSYDNYGLQAWFLDRNENEIYPDKQGLLASL